MLTNLQKWGPLERAVLLAGLPAITPGEFMWMTESPVGVQHYKHIDTRKYVRLAADTCGSACIRGIAEARYTPLQSATLSARVVVITPLHPFHGEHCYIVRSRHGLDQIWLCEVIGQPQCRAWFAEYELMDERRHTEREARL